MSKAKSSNAKPVLQWMLRVSENETHKLEKIVNGWKEKTLEDIDDTELEDVVKGLANLSSQIATADDNNLVPSHLPLMGSVLMTLIELPALLNARADLHKNLLRCLVNMNRTKPNASSIRLRARQWALKALRQMCRLKRDVTVCRQIGYVNADLTSRLRKDELRKCRRRIAKEIPAGENDGNSLLGSIMKQKLYLTEDCIDDVLKCLEVMKPSPLRTEWIESLCADCGGESLPEIFTSGRLERLWLLHPTCFEKSALRLVEQCTKSDHDLGVHIVIKESILIEICSRNAHLLKKLMDIIRAIIPLTSNRFDWLPSMLLGSILRLNPRIELLHFSSHLQPLIPFLSIPLESKTMANFAVNSIYGIMANDTPSQTVKTSLFKYWFRHLYFHTLELLIDRSDIANISVALWLGGCPLKTSESDLDRMVTLGRFLEARNGRIIVNYLQELDYEWTTSIDDFIRDLLIVYIVVNGLNRKDPVVFRLERLNSSEMVEQMKKSFQLISGRNDNNNRVSVR